MYDLVERRWDELKGQHARDAYCVSKYCSVLPVNKADMYLKPKKRYLNTS